MTGGVRMLFFLLVVPTIFFGVHLYLGRRLLDKRLWSKTTRRIGWVALISLSLITMLTSWISRTSWGGDWLDPFQWITYLYMGLFSLVLAGVLLRDLGLGLEKIWRRLQKRSIDKDQPLEPNRRAFLRGLNMGVVSLSGVMASWGTFKALRTLDIEEVKVTIPNLPKGLEGFRIVQVSDLHVGPTVRRPFVEKVVAEVNVLDADLIAITGDLVDGYVPQRREDVAPLANLKASEGVFYVTGNHEYYWGAQPWIDEVRRLGMNALVNAHTVIRRGDASLVIAGVTDLSAGRMEPDQASDPIKAIAGAPPEAYKILMAHQPKSAFAAQKAGFDLQLSGHTHGGQFVPWSLVVWMVQPFVAGLHALEKMQLYVSRGTGYWGPPMRIGANPEITRLTLTRG